MVDAAGVSVIRLRYAALTINGLLCGLAGSYLVLAQSAAFAPNMTAGRGFMALAALIFGNWRPVPALFACLLFGFLDATAIRLQGVSLPGIGEVPVQAVQALPYLLTVILLAGFIGKPSRRSCFKPRAMRRRAPTHPIRSFASAPRCSMSKAASTPAAMSRMRPTPRACAPRPAP
jgi:ABC-type uncharacterized transport system permease subunit